LKSNAETITKEDKTLSGNQGFLIQMYIIQVHKNKPTNSNANGAVRWYKAAYILTQQEALHYDNGMVVNSGKQDGM
jgi:hypothetical protein